MARLSVIQTQPQFQLRYILAIVLLSLSALYFGRYAIWGTKGLLGLWKEEAQLTELSKQLAHQREENASLEKYVNRLSSRSLDLDFLDERARATLGFAFSDEVIILEEPTKENTHE